MESFHICLRNKPIGTSTSSRLLFDSNSALPRLNRSSGLSPIVATPHTLPIYINSSSRNSHATQAGGCFGRAASGFVLWVMRPFAGLYRISSTFGPGGAISATVDHRGRLATFSQPPTSYLPPRPISQPSSIIDSSFINSSFIGSSSFPLPKHFGWLRTIRIDVRNPP